MSKPTAGDHAWHDRPKMGRPIADVGPSLVRNKHADATPEHLKKHGDVSHGDVRKALSNL